MFYYLISFKSRDIPNIQTCSGRDLKWMLIVISLTVNLHRVFLLDMQSIHMVTSCIYMYSQLTQQNYDARQFFFVVLIIIGLRRVKAEYIIISFIL